MVLSSLAREHARHSPTSQYRQPQARAERKTRQREASSTAQPCECPGLVSGIEAELEPTTSPRLSMVAPVATISPAGTKFHLSWMRKMQSLEQPTEYSEYTHRLACSPFSSKAQGIHPCSEAAGPQKLLRDCLHSIFLWKPAVGVAPPSMSEATNSSLSVCPPPSISRGTWAAPQGSTSSRNGSTLQLGKQHAFPSLGRAVRYLAPCCRHMIMRYTYHV